MDESSVDAGAASDMETRESGDLLAEKVQSLHALLDLMLADRTPSGAAGLSQREKGLLDRCLYETYRRAGITSDHRTHNRPAPLLRDLFDVLLSGTCGADEYGLADRLHRYVEGSLARLVSAPTDVALDRHLVVFDVRDLDGELRPLGLLLIADFVWTRVRQKRQPRLLLIDEAWSLIQHQEGGRFLAGLARRARKYWLGLVTITQDVEDFLGSEWGRTVLANSSIQLLMKQDSTTIEAVSSAFRLSSGERQYLLGCHKGEGLLFARGGHVALLVEASPAEHDLVTTDPRELAERAELPGSVERSGQPGQPAPEEQPRRSHPGPTEGQANMPWAIPRAGTDVRAAPDSPPPGPRSRQEGSPPTAPAAMTKKAPARPEHSGVPGARLASHVDDTPDTVDAEGAEVTEDAADSRADTRIRAPRQVSAATGSAGDTSAPRHVGAPSMFLRPVGPPRRSSGRRHPPMMCRDASCLRGAFPARVTIWETSSAHIPWRMSSPLTGSHYAGAARTAWRAVPSTTTTRRAWGSISIPTGSSAFAAARAATSSPLSSASSMSASPRPFADCASARGSATIETGG